MESAKYWLDEDGESCDKAVSQQQPSVFDEANESQNATNANDNASEFKSKEDQESCIDSEDVDDTMPNEKDLLVSLKTPMYREIMFAQFKKLGEKTGVDDFEHLKVVAKELFYSFKRDMGAEGRFFRKVRGASEGEAPYELLDDATALISKCRSSHCITTQFWCHD